MIEWNPTISLRIVVRILQLAASTTRFTQIHEGHSPFEIASKVFFRLENHLQALTVEKPLLRGIVQRRHWKGSLVNSVPSVKVEKIPVGDMETALSPGKEARNQVPMPLRSSPPVKSV